MEIVVKRVAFGMPEATEEDDNFEIQAGLWSREWIGLYWKADPPPPQHIQDLKCGGVERSFYWCSNPKELMANIPELTPIATKALRPTSEPGAFKLVAEADEKMYEANWNELFNPDNQFGDETSAAAAAASTSSAPP